MSSLRNFGATALLACAGIFIVGAPARAEGGELIGADPCEQIVAEPSGVAVSSFDNGGVLRCVIEFRSVGANTWLAPSGLTSFEYLVVAGGGGGGGSVILSDDSSTVISAAPGGNGGNSTLGAITAVGGGGGANGRGRGETEGNGGSGGGSGGRTASSAVGTVRPGGTGIPGQGFAGGASLGQTILGSGGGGAAGVGSDSDQGGACGPGMTSSITGTSVTYATGGAGGINDSKPGASGGDNSGEGGEASSTLSPGSVEPAGSGGSGIVVVRYAADPLVDVGQCLPSLNLSGYLQAKSGELPNTGDSSPSSLVLAGFVLLITGTTLVRRGRRTPADGAD